MSGNRINRLLRLLKELQSGDGGNADGLAEACGVSRRTIFRDIDTLRRAGIPVEFDRQRDRYSICDAHFLPPTNLSAEEALAIICLAHALGRREGLPFFEPAQRAARKLEATLPNDLRDHVRAVARSIHVRRQGVNLMEGKDEVYRTLIDAQAQRRVVRMRYLSLTEWDLLDTDLRPYELVFSKHSWYVIGRSSLHREVRTFHVGRIIGLSKLAETFRRPKSFSLRRYLRNAWTIVPEPGEDVDVHIRFAALVATNVSEVQWHHTQQCELRDDGSLDFYVTVSGVNEISWWVLGYGDQAEVVAPARLRNLVARRAANMADMYRMRA